jgi:hypothetical protein
VTRFVSGVIVMSSGVPNVVPFPKIHSAGWPSSRTIEWIVSECVSRASVFSPLRFWM